MIVGVAGLSGSGHQDALAVAAGALRPERGRVMLPDGTQLRPGLRNAIRQGIALVPGDRQRIGLMLDKSLWENVAQVRAVALRRSGSFLRASQLRARARVHVERLGIRTSSVDQEVRYLSGGNQQKVVFARWLEAEPSVLLLDDPTRGIDVGARAEIYALMRNLAEQGMTLAERRRAAVWASPMSGRCSFPEDHAQFAGFLPPVRSLLAAKLAAYDVVLVLGAPIFTYHVQSVGPIVPAGVQLYQIIDDPEAAAWSPVGTSLLATLRLGLSHLLELVPPASRPVPVPLKRLAVPEKLDPIPPAFVMHSIAQLMPADAVIVEEAPSHRNDLHDYLPIRQRDGFYTGASGGLGYSLPAAVGIALAEPARRIICVLGDGSSMYSIQALWNAVQHHLPITFVILNNQEYAALKSFGRVFNTPNFPGADLPGIDIPAIARGYGCPAVCIERSSDLAAALSEAFASAGPVVVDVIVDRAPIILY